MNNISTQFDHFLNVLNESDDSDDISEGDERSESSPHLQILGNGYSAFHFLNTTAYYIVQNSTGRSIRIVSNTNLGCQR